MPPNNLSQEERQKIYDNWHKELYQVNTSESIKGLDKLHKEAIKLLSLKPKLRVLDLACGKGLFLKDLKSKELNFKLYGVDISQVAINEAKRIVNCDLRQSDAENLPFKNNFFDRIVCLGGLEYFQDPVKGAKEVSRALKKDGIAVFLVPNLMFLGYIWLALKYGMMPTHGGSDKKGKVYYDYNSEKFLTNKGWIDILKKGELKVIKSYPYTYIGNTRFANPISLWFYNKFFYKLIPYNLSYAFIFVCKKKQ